MVVTSVKTLVLRIRTTTGDEFSLRFAPEEGLRAFNSFSNEERIVCYGRTFIVEKMDLICPTNPICAYDRDDEHVSDH